MAQVQVRVLEPGTKVTIKPPNDSEPGTWIVHERVVASGLEDAVYDLFHSRSGRHTFQRRSRLTVTREDTNGG
jgi:hypothetical protein